MHVAFMALSCEYRALLNLYESLWNAKYASLECIYGVACVSRIDKIIGLLCERAPIKETIFCKRDL